VHTVLRSFIKQILNVFENIPSDIEEDLQGLFVNSPAEPTAAELFQILTQVEKLSATTYLIVDGLDECNDSDRRQLLSYLIQLGGMEGRKIKVIVSSRPEVDISSHLDKCFIELSLSPRAAAEADISAFIRHEVKKRIGDKRLIVQQSTMVQEIQDALVDGSDGMYV
jgi:hypothetical protein